MTNKKIWKSLWAAVKEPLRLLVLSAIPVVIVYLKDFPYWWAAVATLFLRLADKILHEIGKETENKNLLKGITRF